MRALVGILLLTVTGCGFRSGPLVHFVLPDGYHGAFYLICDPANGLVVSAREGQFTVAIPAGGRLRVRDFRFLKSWHQETAMFANGASIPTGDLATNVVGLRSGSTISSSGGPEFVWYVVGTQQDFDTITRHDLRP